MQNDPPILTRLVGQLREKGMSPEHARNTAIQTLVRSGNIVMVGGFPVATAKGEQRGAMTAGERAIDREIQRSPVQHDPSEYEYDEKTNRARLKKVAPESSRRTHQKRGWKKGWRRG